MPAFRAREKDREARKREELAPCIEAARARNSCMKPLADHEIPIARASVKRAEVPRR